MNTGDYVIYRMQRDERRRVIARKVLPWVAVVALVGLYALVSWGAAL